MKKTLKKKGFLIDKITEDSFYENLLLGLSSVLKSCQFVSHIKLERFDPATLGEVTAWEDANELRLPEDFRNFFLSTNGFSYTYRFQYDKADSEEDSLTAGIEINPLSEMERIAVTDTKYLTDGGMRFLAPNSQVHLVTKLADNNFVVLARFNPANPPTFWLYFKSKVFYFLCEDITTYFRMALAHVGAPGWQLAVLKADLPEWSAELIQILAPGIANNRQLFETKHEPNKIDCKIFEVASDSQLGAENCEGLKSCENTPRKGTPKAAKIKPKK